MSLSNQKNARDKLVMTSM